MVCWTEGLEPTNLRRRSLYPALTAGSEKAYFFEPKIAKSQIFKVLR